MTTLPVDPGDRSVLWRDGFPPTWHLKRVKCRHGWRSPGLRRETVGGAGRQRELRSRARMGRRGGGEAEGGCPSRRGASRQLW